MKRCFLTGTTGMHACTAVHAWDYWIHALHAWDYWIHALHAWDILDPDIIDPPIYGLRIQAVACSLWRTDRRGSTLAYIFPLHICHTLPPLDQSGQVQPRTVGRSLNIYRHLSAGHISTNATTAYCTLLHMLCYV